MTLRLEVISEQKGLLGDETEICFGPEGGTIGRSLRNDWVLPDPERFISGQHATIDYQAGSYYLADTSSNGVYINGAIEPIGKGHPRRLFDGDRLRMGNFEMCVHLDEGEDLDLPPDPEPSVVPDHIEQLVPVDDTPSSIKLLDEEEIAGDSAFDAAVIVDDDDDDYGSLDGYDLAPQDDAEDEIAAEPTPVAPARQPAATAGGESADTELLYTFLRAAGIDPNDIHPSVDASELLQNAGELLNELVGGVTEMLVARSNVKSMFRLDQTAVMPRHNNPLKLSIDTVDSLRQLLVGREGEYLGPLDSVREACKDLRYHHDALVAGMIRGFDEYIERFSPTQLEEHFSSETGRKSVFGGLGRRRQWDLYCDLYPIMTEKGPAAVPRQFAEDFVRCYERQLKDFKRREAALGDTQRLDYEDPLGAGQADPAASGETEALVAAAEDTGITDTIALNPRTRTSRSQVG